MRMNKMQNISKYFRYFPKNLRANLMLWIVFYSILESFTRPILFPEDVQIPRTVKKNLLRVLPAFRPEECDWAIRKFICLRCHKNGFSYAQNIIFVEDDRPYRLHGCYSEEKGFFPISEGQDEKLDFVD